MKKRKKFSQALYDSNNKKGIMNAISLFESNFAWRVDKDLKEMFKDGDIIFTDYEDQRYIVEVEVKNVGWKSDNSFKYPTIHFAYKPETKADFFVSFNDKCNRAFVCKTEDLIKPENIIRKDTRNKETGEITYNEPFYEIHISMCELYIKYKDGEWYER